jgi:hypothetical protein
LDDSTATDIQATIATHTQVAVDDVCPAGF